MACIAFAGSSYWHCTFLWHCHACTLKLKKSNFCFDLLAYSWNRPHYYYSFYVGLILLNLPSNRLTYVRNCFISWSIMMLAKIKVLTFSLLFQHTIYTRVNGPTKWNLRVISTAVGLITRVYIVCWNPSNCLHFILPSHFFYQNRPNQYKTSMKLTCFGSVGLQATASKK